MAGPPPASTVDMMIPFMQMVKAFSLLRTTTWLFCFYQNQRDGSQHLIIQTSRRGNKYGCEGGPCPSSQSRTCCNLRLDEVDDGRFSERTEVPELVAFAGDDFSHDAAHDLTRVDDRTMGWREEKPTLPLLVFGKSATIKIFLGAANGPITLRTVIINSLVREASSSYLYSLWMSGCMVGLDLMDGGMGLRFESDEGVDGLSGEFVGGSDDWKDV